MSRVFVCVLDGCGAGALPDAAAYGDEGSDTLRHVLERVDVPLPNLAGLGLGEIVGLPLGTPRRRGDLRSPGRARRRQGHDHRPLGDDGGRARAALPDVSRRLPARGHGAVRGGDRPAGAVQPAGLRHGHHRRARRRARGHRPAHRVHLCGFGLPDRLSRGRRPGPAALCVVRDGARDPARPACRRPRHRAAVRRRVGPLRAHAAAPRLLAGAAGPDLSGPAPGAGGTRGRGRQDRRDLRAARR